MISLRTALLSLTLAVLPGSCIAAQVPPGTKVGKPVSIERVIVPAPPPLPLALGAFRLDKAPEQGGLARGRAPAGSVRLVIDGQNVVIAPDGAFVVGFGRDYKESVTLAAFKRDGTAVTEKLPVAKRAWHIENLSTLPHHSQPDAEFAARRPAELAQILAQLPIAGTSFDEETLENYEVGIKGSFLDGRLRVALDGYIGRYRGAQVPVSVVVTRATTPPTITTLGPTINIGNIDLKGVEFEAEAIVFPGFRVGATFAYTDTKIKRYYCSECSNILAQNTGIPNGPSILANSINYTAAEGKRLPGAPQITYTVSANYENEVANDLTAYIGGDFIYRGKYYADAANIASSGDSELFNARLGLRTGNYNVEIFARNLFDDTSPGIVYTALGPNAAPFSLPSVNGLNIALPDRRRIGIRVSASF